MSDKNKPSGWVGWVYFSGILMIVMSIFQAFLGYVALANNSFYQVSNNSLNFYNFSAWGWGHLILSIILLTAGFSVLSGRFWGRAIGIISFSISLLVNLVFMPAYPIWLTAAVIIDAIILYALIVHGHEAKAED